MTERPRGPWREASQAASTALGGALAWGTAGIVLALAAPLCRPWPQAPEPVRWLVQLALGFGLGWWVGLLWTAILARRLLAASISSGWRVALPWVAALAAAGLATTLATLGLGWRPAVLAAVAIVSVGARLLRRPNGAVRCW